MKPYVELVFVLDRSGSMYSIREDAIGGFNRFLADHKAVPGDAKFTLVLFDHEYIKPFNRVALGEITELTDATYVPRGSTALLDAVGQTIDDLGNAYSHDNHKPEKVIFVILTDGEENASHKYSREAVAQRIDHQTKKYGWEFVFLGANFDAFSYGGLLNIPIKNTHQYTADAIGTRKAYAFASSSTVSMRAPQPETTGGDEDSVNNLKVP